MDDQSKPTKPQLRKWLPGVSPNPGGLPQRELREIKILIRKYGPEIMSAMIAIALGDARRIGYTKRGEEVEVGPSFADSKAAAELVMAYGYGKPTQAIELSTTEGGASGSAFDASKLEPHEFLELQRLMLKARTPQAEAPAEVVKTTEGQVQEE